MDSYITKKNKLLKELVQLDDSKLLPRRVTVTYFGTSVNLSCTSKSPNKLKTFLRNNVRSNEPVRVST